jgi:hypothetical protein
MGFIPDDSGAEGLNVIAYGEPGTLRGARLPINAYHSAKNNSWHQHYKSYKNIENHA